MDEKRLVGLISDFVKTTPSETIRLVVDALEHWDTSQSALHQLNLLTAIHSPATKSKLNKLLDTWVQEFPQLPAQGLALVIQTSLITQETSQEPSVELVWTGPSALFPLRRTDQALLELIDGVYY